MKKMRLAILGLGNVSLAVLRYISEKAPRETMHALGLKEILVTGVATGRRGIAIDENGISIPELLKLGKEGLVTPLNKGPRAKDNLEFIKNASADTLLVTTPANVPSVEEIKAAFSRGMHVVTSNKTPVANFYRELTEEARKRGLQFRFGATALAGFPPWRHFFEAITRPEITEMQIVVNATSNQILTMMHGEGKTFAEGIAKAQELGIAERDPSDDVDGLDTQKKLAILANILMDADLTPDDIPTVGIRGITVEQLRKADENGKWVQLLGRAWKDAEGKVKAEVKPVEIDNPFFVRMRGTSMGLYFVTPAANFGFWLDLGKGERAIMATAAGVFEDIMTIAKTIKV